MKADFVQAACKASMVTSLMSVKRIAQQGLTRPFGDERTVNQAFPSAIGTADADPFLMCDYFDMKVPHDPSPDPDVFPVDWHPHRGFDICSYMRSGTGRHGDSLGNRETYETPGMQWMSTGSGVVHAEGGADKAGVQMQGFQIWVNVPSEKKIYDPRYGTVPTKDLPLVSISEGVTARVLAGEAFDKVGSFKSGQPVQMIDFELAANSLVSFDVADGLDTTILYLYEGELTGLNERDETIPTGSVVLLDASVAENRGIQLMTGANPGKVLMFAGKKLNESVAWHGPIVMNTQEEVRATLKELRSGSFPPVRVDWDYKRLASKPE